MSSSSIYDINIEEIDENYSRAEQPANVKVKLWAHQLALLQRCKDYENQKIPLGEFDILKSNHPNLTPNDFLRTQVGIIGDRVGSGKSYVILSLILDNDITNLGSTIKSYGNNKVILCFQERNINIRTNLLVIPHNLSSQWETYIQNFSNIIKYYVVSKLKNVEYIYNNESHIKNYDLIVVTSSYYSRIAHFLTSRSLKMQRVIYDEVDNMNLPNCVTIESNFYWFITASYGNLLYPKGYTRWDYTQNKHIWYANGLRNAGFVKELFLDLYSNLSKEFVKVLILKSNEDFIKSSVCIPDMTVKIVKCKTPLTINILDGFVDREIILSLNAGDIQNAMQRISSNHKSTEENLISLQIEKYIRELKNYDIRIESLQMMSFDTEEQRQNEIGKLETKKNEIKQKIDGIQDRIRNTNICNICFDDIQNKTIAPCCQNCYCFLCLNIWLYKNKSCPMCKRSLIPEDLLLVKNNSQIQEYEELNEDDVNEQFDKLKNLEIILKNTVTNKGKLIIYSSYDMSFSHVIKIMARLQIKYASIKGPIDHIKKTIDRYKNEDVNVLLMNSRIYGSGMNLENTTDIVMFHKVDSEIEKQIIGRANRYPRTTSLNVHYLLYENEIY
jgi:hypothetical protein